MAFKFFALAALVAAANAGVLAPAGHFAYGAAPVYAAAPVAKAVYAKAVDAEYDPHPQYTYGYDVHDSITGDQKTQHESRNGDVVEGSYSLIEADGTRRVVEYTADPIHGFNAVVHKEPATVALKAVAPVAVKTVAPVAHALPYAHAAPVAHTVHAPLSYAAPFAKYASYAAPIAKIAAPVAHYATSSSYAAPVVSAAHAPVTYTSHAAPVYHH